MNISSWQNKDLVNGDDVETVRIENNPISNLKFSDELALKRVGGGSIIEHRPLFSDDGELIYIVWNNLIKVHATQTGALIGELEAADDPIIRAVSFPGDPEKIVACTSGKEIIFWDGDKGDVKLKTSLECKDQQIDLRTFHIIQYTTRADKKVEEGLVTYTRTTSDNNIKLYVELYDLYNGKKTWNKIINFGPEDYYVDVAGNYNENLICIAQATVLYIYSPAHNVYKKHFTNRPFTCIRGHPEEECVATGDVSGRVEIWRDITNHQPIKGTYHWHMLPVNEIIFSSMGIYMYTGGAENVLVKWTLHNPGEKAFLPRLPAPIMYLSISPENDYLSISTADNGITVTDAHREIISTIQNFTHNMENLDGVVYPAGLILDPLTNCLVLNSRTGHIQFFKPSSSNLLYNINITGENIATQERDCVVVNTDVYKIAVNHDGSWLLTYEERDDRCTYKELRLRFWKYDTEKQNYSLNTVCQFPHEKGISLIKFRPKFLDEEDDVAISVGEDNLFKLWYFPRNSITEEPRWECYEEKSFQDLKPNGADFAMDGSLLAVGFKNNLTIWDPEPLEFRCNLTHVKLDKKIRQIEFGKEDFSHLIVVVYEECVTVWNIDDLSIKWIVQIDASILVSDPKSVYMAAITVNNSLIVFTPETFKPVYTKENFLDQNVKILGSCFVPHEETPEDLMDWQQQSQLYFLTSNKDILTLGIVRDASDSYGSYTPSVSIPRTLFSKILCPQTKDEMNPNKHDIHSHSLDMTHEEMCNWLVSTEPHKLPPITTLVTPFLVSLIKKQQSAQQYARGYKKYKEEAKAEEKKKKREENSELLSQKKIFQEPDKQNTEKKKKNDNDESDADTDLEKYANADFSFLRGVLPSGDYDPEEQDRLLLERYPVTEDELEISSEKKEKKLKKKRTKKVEEENESTDEEI